MPPGSQTIQGKDREGNKLKIVLEGKKKVLATSGRFGEVVKQLARIGDSSSTTSKEIAIKFSLIQDKKSDDDEEEEEGSSKDSSSVEASILRNVNHPNIIKLLFSFKENNNGRRRFAFAMDLFDMNLQIYVERAKESNEHERLKANGLNFSRQILSGLQYLHDQNIGHMDVCPENCVIRRTTGQLKLVGFKNSIYFEWRKKTTTKEDEEDSSSQSSGSKVYYKSPELLLKSSSSNIGTKSDIWSAAITFIFINVGELPFEKAEEDASMFGKIKKVLGAPTRNDCEEMGVATTREILSKPGRMTKDRLEKICGKVGVEFLHLVTKMLNYSPKKRMNANDAMVVLEFVEVYEIKRESGGGKDDEGTWRNKTTATIEEEEELPTEFTRYPLSKNKTNEVSLVDSGKTLSNDVYFSGDSSVLTEEHFAAPPPGVASLLQKRPHSAVAAADEEMMRANKHRRMDSATGIALVQTMIEKVNSKEKIEEEISKAVNIRSSINANDVKLQSLRTELAKLEENIVNTGQDTENLRRDPDFRNEVQIKELEEELKTIGELIATCQRTNNNNNKNDVVVVVVDSGKSCPSCLNPYKEIYSCQDCDNWICDECNRQLALCPTCQADFKVKPTKRNVAVERALSRV